MNPGPAIPAGTDRVALVERFHRKYAVHGDGCWHWVGNRNAGGYGRMTFYDGAGRRVYAYAHRLAYELLVGPIPDGLTLDHLCRVHECVNPGHLEPVTTGENTRRAGDVVTVCAAGHPYNEVNTRWRKTGSGGRKACRACQRDRMRRLRRGAAA